MRINGLLMAAAAAALFACGGDGGNGNNNSNNLDQFLLSPSFLTSGVGQAPDFRCFGQPDAALIYDTPTQISGIVQDFEEDYPVEGIEVSIYETLQDLLDDVPYDTSALSDPNGEYTVMAPPNRQRLFFRTIDPTGQLYFDTMELNEPVAGFPPGPAQTTGKDRIVVSAITMETVPAIMGIVRLDGRGIVAGTVFDCAALDVEHAAMRAYDKPASDPTRQLISIYEGPDRNAFYFDNEMPVRLQEFTDVNGQFLIANLVPGQPVTMEMWGRLNAGDTPAGYEDCTEGCLISTQEIPVLPDTIVVTDMVPLQ